MSIISQLFTKAYEMASSGSLPHPEGYFHPLRSLCSAPALPSSITHRAPRRTEGEEPVGFCGNDQDRQRQGFIHQPVVQASSHSTTSPFLDVTVTFPEVYGTA